MNPHLRRSPTNNHLRWVCIIILVVALLSDGEAMTITTTTTPSLMRKLSTKPPFLLSDLPTPSFIIDTRALFRQQQQPQLQQQPQNVVASSINILSPFVPIISIPCPEGNGDLLLLRPTMIGGMHQYNDENSNPNCNAIVECNFGVIEGQAAIGYIHSSVIRTRCDNDDTSSDDDDDDDDDVDVVDDGASTTFLAEIDATPTLCAGPAKLVLGLNNHHVGGYYWARSSGAGSSMEAPGVSFGYSGSSNTSSNRGGLLHWTDANGPRACNSNDGKRSEWVNFLRLGDTVQLVPTNGQESILQFVQRYGSQQPTSNVDDDALLMSSTRIFGISSHGRPMGSEPEVVCVWNSLNTTK